MPSSFHSRSHGAKLTNSSHPIRRMTTAIHLTHPLRCRPSPRTPKKMKHANHRHRHRHRKFDCAMAKTKGDTNEETAHRIEKLPSILLLNIAILSHSRRH